VPPQPSEPARIRRTAYSASNTNTAAITGLSAGTIPQEPPQPSDPQALPEQLGVQPATQAPLLLQDCPEAQVRKNRHTHRIRKFFRTTGVQVFPSTRRPNKFGAAQAVTLDQAVHPLLATGRFGSHCRCTGLNRKYKHGAGRGANARRASLAGRTFGAVIDKSGAEHCKPATKGCDGLQYFCCTQ